MDLQSQCAFLKFFIIKVHARITTKCKCNHWHFAKLSWLFKKVITNVQGAKTRVAITLKSFPFYASEFL